LPFASAGNSTKKAIPNVLGVSKPKGIAVTVSLLSFFASPHAIKVNAISPISTPNAVPGSIRVSTNSGVYPLGIPAKVKRLNREIMTARLSIDKPKKAFQSPRENHFMFISNP